MYATGSSRKVVTVDASTGRPTGSFQAGRHALSALAASPDQKFVLVGSSSLALWALGDQERASKYTGHPTPVRAATFTPDGAFALSAAEGERHVAVWHTSPTARKHKKMQVAAGSLSLDEPAVQLHACDSGLGDGSFVALAVSEAGEAYVWLCAAQEDGSLKAEQLARIRVGGAAGKNAAAGLAECVMAARLQTGAAGEPSPASVAELPGTIASMRFAAAGQGSC